MPSNKILLKNIYQNDIQNVLSRSTWDVFTCEINIGMKKYAIW